MLGDLSAGYESNGDAGCISDGYNDAGGKSYGAYQFSSAKGTLANYVAWLSGTNSTFYQALSQPILAGDEFDSAWKQLATDYYDEFFQSQHDYIKELFYDPAVDALRVQGFNIENHSEVMQDVVWSRAVQYGVGSAEGEDGVVGMFIEAVTKMFNHETGEYSGFPNLSYVDDASFDYDFIYAVYMLVCSSYEWNSGPSRDSLNNRFSRECHDALSRL